MRSTLNDTGPATVRVGSYLRGAVLRTTASGTWFAATRARRDRTAGLLLVHPSVDGVELGAIHAKLAKIPSVANGWARPGQRPRPWPRFLAVGSAASWLPR